MSLRFLAGWVVVLGCSERSPAPPPTASPAPTPATEARVIEAVPDHTVWRGLYRCSQGITGLKLTIDANAGAATAVFEFEAVDATPDVPPGSYRLRGTMTTGDDGGLVVALEPAAWIVQPPRYVMVGITARTDAAREVLRGRISHPSCSTIEVRRVE